MNTINLPTLGALLTAHGGYLAAILPGIAADGGQDFALILADSRGEFEDVTWANGDYLDVPGAVDPIDGPANTRAMAEAGSDLAKRIQALDIHGHTDWYLPAAAELRAMSATVPRLFEQKDWYWSSSQGGTYHAWVQAFEDGTSYPNLKGIEHRARAVRRIPLSSFNA